MNTQRKRLFVLVRDDLKSMAYKAVQAGHAVAQFMIDHPDSDWQNSYLIYVTVPDLKMLELWQETLETRCLPLSIFREPDIGDEITAIACYPSSSKVLDKLPLL